MTERMSSLSEPVGMVLGTEDSTPLSFWVGISAGAYLQLDDAVVVQTEVPGRGTIRVSGIVQQVRARHEGTSFDSDVFLIDKGILPADTAQAAQIGRRSRAGGRSVSRGSSSRFGPATRAPRSIPTCS